VARVEGEGLKSRGHYVAREAMARGLFWLHEVEGEQQEPVPGIKIRLNPDIIRLVAKRKLPRESLASAVERLLLQVCEKSSSGQL
jgi:hypothetical protein